MNFLRGNTYISIISVVCIAIGCYYSFTFINQPLIGTDDANILFVYAKNFVHGNGIVYNVGGEHVEGFTCFLYFIICSAFYLITPNPEVIIFFFNLILSIISILYIQYTIQLISTKLTFSKKLRICLQIGFLAWLISNPLYFGWNIISLMDTGLYSFILITIFCFFIQLLFDSDINKEKKAILLSLLIIALILTRPEAIIWGIVFIALFAFIIHLQTRNFNKTIKLIIKPIIGYTVSFIIITIFRLIYFKFPFPNTFYAKVSASLEQTLSDGFNYFENFIEQYGVVLVIFLALSTTFILIEYIKNNTSIKFLLGFIIILINITGITIPIVEGADHFHGFRMYQPIYPILYFIYLIPLFYFRKKISFYYTYLFLIVGGFWISKNIYQNWLNFKNSQNLSEPIANYQFSISNEFYIAANERENGKILSMIFEDSLPKIGYGSAGGIAYGYKGNIIDMMGLNNTLMAHANTIKVGPKGHESFDKETFYELAPEILMAQTFKANMINLQGANDYYTNPTTWDNMIFKNIFNDYSFKERYQLAEIINKDFPEYGCVGYFRKDYLNYFNNQSKFIVQPYE
jgi:arabinofuranosyltransferase